MRFIRHTFDVDAELVGNESADIIRGKDFSRSRCLLTLFQAGDGHDKAPESVKHPQWTMKSAPQYGLGRSCSPTYSCYASTNRRSREAAYAAGCSKRATQLGNVGRANRKPRCRRNGPSGCMLSVRVFGPGGT